MEVDWSVVVGECMTQILRILIPVCVALVLKWAVELYHKLKTEQPEWVPVLEYAAEVAVLAAEQIFGHGKGDEKRAYAIETIERILAEHGINVDVEVITDAIEAEVQKWFPHNEKAEIQTGGVVHYSDIPPIDIDPAKFGVTTETIKEEIKRMVKSNEVTE